MHYSEKLQEGNSYSHMWDVSSMKILDGGFLLDKTSLPADAKKLPKGVFMSGNLVERTAKVIKSAVVAEAVSGTDTTVKIKKGSLLSKTDIIGVGTKSVTVGDIDTSSEGSDSFTITANALGTLKVGDVLQTYNEAGSNKTPVNPDGLNPFEVEIDSEPTCSIMFRADGIVKSRLPQAVTPAIESALKDCQFLNL